MEKGSGAIYGISQSEVNEFLKAPGAIGGTTPAAGTFTPLKAKGSAIITTFAGTVTATASTTVTFSSAADAILAGYSATNPMLGTMLISNALTRHIVSWTNATTCVVDLAVTWAGTAITSVQLPIATFVNSSGVTTGWMNAEGILKVISGSATDSFTSSGASSGTLSTNIFNTNTAGSAALNIGVVTGGSDYFQFLKRGSTHASAGQVYVYNISNALMHIGTNNADVIVLDGSGNIMFGGLAAAGTSAAKVLAMASGTVPTTSPADAAQMWVADYLASAGDARLHIMGEGSAAAKTVLGSGKVGITGTTGGFTRQLAEATSGALSGASGSIAVNVPSGTRILGVQLRVDTAITSDNATKTWAATYANTPTTAITSGQVFAANTKFNAIHPAYEITTGTVTITITAAAGLFTGGVVRAICYYESIDAMASL